MKYPPRLAVALMTVLLRKDVREAVLGDLHEEFQARAKMDSTQAGRWYWDQVIGSVCPLLVCRARSTGGYLATGTGPGSVAAVSFLALAALSVLLFSRVVVSVELRLLTYLGCAFSAGTVGGFICRGRESWGWTVAVAIVPILLVLLMFAASPEKESVFVGIIWSLVILAGTRAGQGIRSLQVAS